MKKIGIIPLGIALFTMFFGAGNIVYPLILGRETAGNIIPGLIGFIITGVAVPIIGFLATSLYEGNYEKFFQSIGKIPARVVIILSMIIIGILASARCIIVSYASIQQYIPWCSLFTYSLIVGALIFILTFKENMVVKLLGKVLGPIKITLLLSILFLVVINLKKIPSSNLSAGQSILTGLQDGYLSLDLLAGLFFSHLIYATMKEEKLSSKQLIKKGLKVGFFGGILLACIYCGFALVAALHSLSLANIADQKLFATLAINILGTAGGILANTTVAIATLTTAMSLVTVFSDYLTYDMFKGKISYLAALTFTIIINIAFANLDFSGIMKVIVPIALIIYPALIALSITSILNKLYNFKYVKSVTFATFFVTLIFYMNRFLK